MSITNEVKKDLLGKIKVAGIKVEDKHYQEFTDFGTVVLSANKAKKKKLDDVLEKCSEASFIDVTEFDDNMWRLTDIDVSENLDIIARGKEFQNE